MSALHPHAWTHVTLGPRILRAETAAIAAIAIASRMQQVNESQSSKSAVARSSRFILQAEGRQHFARYPG